MNPLGLRAAAQLSPIRINAAGAYDARGTALAPAALLIDARAAIARPRTIHLLAIGTPQQLDAHPLARCAPAFELPQTVLLPALVNAHTHLDLTHIGPQPHDPSRGFMSWVEMIRARRAADDEQVRASVSRGVELSRSAGVLAVGDIAGAPQSTPARASLTPWRALRDAGLRGVSYLEFFAIGTGRERFRQWLPQLLDAARNEASKDDLARIGLQPHAPNTVCLDAYRWAFEQAAASGLPVATHLAESPEERAFIADGRGPMRELLERLNLWDDTITAETGRSATPVEHLAPVLEPAGPRAVVAHVNDASGHDLELLAKTGCSVAYCPRASAYFGAHEHFGPHRYRDMLHAGINVALGTDSIVNLPDAAARTPDEGGQGISILDEMRLLWQRDRIPARQLLAMATVNGARALGLPPELFTLQAGAFIAGLASIDLGNAGQTSASPLETVLAEPGTARLLLD